MILFSQFGYAMRHSISYNPKSKPGSVRLWASHDGSILGPDPLKNGDNSLLELLAHQSRRSPLLGSSTYATFSLGNDDDVFSISAAITMIKRGGDYSFKNYAGRMISFSRSKVGSENHEIVLVSIRHKTEVGILTMQELDEFEIVTESILANLGYSKQQIAEKVELLVAQFSNEGDENARNARAD
jgi:hypothetical protein